MDKRAKVTSIGKNKRPLRLTDVMATAVAALLDATGEPPKVSDVVFWIIRHHGYRWHAGGGDGSAPTYSVNLNPVDGWSLHT